MSREAAQPGDHVALKKPHACGANEWEVLRLSADVRLRCAQCGRLVTLARREFERRVRTPTQRGRFSQPLAEPDDARRQE
ncbi:MAG TPA: DUF951 domain-containing protein [Armatimonadota bacterium]|nr:DUF951 domain-containing protein [Armatimonadota bacterium]